MAAAAFSVASSMTSPAATKLGKEQSLGASFMVPSNLSLSLPQGLQYPTRRLHGIRSLERLNLKLKVNALQSKVAYDELPKRRAQITAQALTASEVPPSPSLDNAEYRRQLAGSYGYTQIGEPLPEGVTLKDIVETIPKKLYEIDDMKALQALLSSVGAYGLGLYVTSQLPWYLLPLGWALTGTAASGLFCIGHDCGHKSFSRNKLLEDIIGTVVMLPLIYPYEGWRFEHDRHHSKTNMLHEDTGWHPIWLDDFKGSPMLRQAMIYGYGMFRPWMTIAHWLLWHFDTDKFRPNEVKRVRISVACVYAFIMIAMPLLIHATGFSGWFNYWFMPWLVFHFWFSNVTTIHHSAPHIPFKARDEWSAVQAQFSGTVHCDFPMWIEEMLHHINVHVPHHLAPRIPSYNLRAAHKSLRENWGNYLSEAKWSWRLMKTIMTKCHVYNPGKKNPDENYLPFDELAPEEAGSVSIIKKLMPDWT